MPNRQLELQGDSMKNSRISEYQLLVFEHNREEAFELAV